MGAVPPTRLGYKSVVKTREGRRPLEVSVFSAQWGRGNVCTPFLGSKWGTQSALWSGGPSSQVALRLGIG